ncbi:response regulator transcription factor [Sphaerotilus sp.]|uniref:response regulator transcription factor n=1 Tax=Sphaerotilus sp. TaxID=2093942 RepID=UPI002ACEDCA7|nr:response regulator transcription factor [Sphaerotilus sp.]MDZ7855169.1 response regulator transcription factor [Sphaerotilus sp.]
MPFLTSSPVPLRLAIADDHAIVRMGYRRLLEDEPGLRVVAEYGDADSAWADLCRRSEGEIDLLILDLSMPGRSGLDLLQQLHAERPALKVLVFTMHDTEALRAQCLRAGAVGLIGKSSDPECLLDAVRQIAHVAPASVRATAPSVAARRSDLPGHHHLTLREHDALMGLLRGWTLDQIAAEMGVSDKTVSNYQTLIRQKLGVNTAVELMRYGQAHGLIP